MCLDSMRRYAVRAAFSTTCPRFTCVPCESRQTTTQVHASPARRPLPPAMFVRSAALQALPWLQRYTCGGSTSRQGRRILWSSASATHSRTVSSDAREVCVATASDRQFNTWIRRLAFAGRYEDAVAAVGARASSGRVVASRHASTLLRCIGLAHPGECIGRAMAHLKLAGAFPELMSEAQLRDVFGCALHFQDMADIVGRTSVREAVEMTGGVRAVAKLRADKQARQQAEQRQRRLAQQSSGDRDGRSRGQDAPAASRVVTPVAAARAGAIAETAPTFTQERHRRCLDTANSLAAHGVVLDGVSYAVLLAAAAEAGAVDDARRLLTTALDTGAVCATRLWEVFQEQFGRKLVDQGVLDGDMWESCAPQRDSATGKVVLRKDSHPLTDASDTDGIDMAGIFAIANDAARRGRKAGQHGAVRVFPCHTPCACSVMCAGATHLDALLSCCGRCRCCCKATATCSLLATTTSTPEKSSTLSNTRCDGSSRSFARGVRPQRTCRSGWHAVM